MNIGMRIKERRKYLGMSVDDIANKLNKNRATIYRYESNDIENLPVTILEPLAKILETTPAYLMGVENQSTSEKALSNKEEILLSNFNKLNDLGKNEAIKRVEELTYVDRYILDNKEYLKPLAAHDKKGNFSEEDREHDINLMKDDSIWD